MKENRNELEVVCGGSSFINAGEFLEGVKSLGK
jgi:hypothetical protein